jgi:predicted AAA+ superfamily ATPase
MRRAKTIFETCKPWPEAQSGDMKHDRFLADLSQAVRGIAPKKYSDPVTFFSHTYPTRGIRLLLENVCRRICGHNSEVASIFRLQMKYGSGKTHNLIMLAHIASGLRGVANISDFIDPALLPKGRVRLVSIDGEKSDPINGLLLEDDLRAYRLWGELAYQLSGIAGYKQFEEGERLYSAPDAATISKLFTDQPTIILLDSMSIYLRKIEGAYSQARKQFSTFIQELFRAVASAPNIALVYTLSVGNEDEFKDSFRIENRNTLTIMDEAGRVSAGETMCLSPTEIDEIPDVMRRCLFEHVDMTSAEEVITLGSEMHHSNGHNLAFSRNTQPVSPHLSFPPRNSKVSDGEDRLVEYFFTWHSAHIIRHCVHPVEKATT